MFFQDACESTRFSKQMSAFFEFLQKFPKQKYISRSDKDAGRIYRPPKVPALEDENWTRALLRLRYL